MTQIVVQFDLALSGVEPNFEVVQSSELLNLAARPHFTTKSQQNQRRYNTTSNSSG